LLKGIGEEKEVRRGRKRGGEGARQRGREAEGGRDKKERERREKKGKTLVLQGVAEE